MHMFAAVADKIYNIHRVLLNHISRHEAKKTGGTALTVSNIVPTIIVETKQDRYIHGRHRTAINL